jgi:hypothetical protein
MKLDDGYTVFKRMNTGYSKQCDGGGDFGEVGSQGCNNMLLNSPGRISNLYYSNIFQRFSKKEGKIMVLCQEV